jgi:NAD(P)H-dependent FMN reductase
MPMYSTDEEISNGFSENTLRFSNLFEEYDGFIISLAEHNGYYTAAFKNMFDWASRVDIKIFRDKPIMLTATSPGKRGGLTVLEYASSSFPRFGAKQVVSFSLPSFNANFQNGKIVNEEFSLELKGKIQEFENYVNQ